MVIITFIYVIFTIWMCITNYTVSKLTKKQYEESKKQLEYHHEDQLRLLYKPILQMEIVPEQSTYLFTLECPVTPRKHTSFSYNAIKLKNIGNGTATILFFSWVHSGADEFDNPVIPPINGIMSGDSYYINMLSFYNNNYPKENNAVLELHYSDILGYDHKQRIYFSFSQEKLVKIENESPEPEYPKDDI